LSKPPCVRSPAAVATPNHDPFSQASNTSSEILSLSSNPLPLALIFSFLPTDFLMVLQLIFSNLKKGVRRPPHHHFSRPFFSYGCSRYFSPPLQREGFYHFLLRAPSLAAPKQDLKDGVPLPFFPHLLPRSAFQTFPFPLPGRGFPPFQHHLPSKKAPAPSTDLEEMASNYRPISLPRRARFFAGSPFFKQIAPSHALYRSICSFSGRA